jgi:hypothetical protein
MMRDGRRLIWIEDPAAVAFYGGSGPVFASAGLIALAPLDVAWQGISDLHQRSLGETVSPFSPAAGLTPDEAFTEYSNAIAGVLGQLGATDATAGNRMLESLNGFADFQGGLDGLLSAYFSSYLSAGRDGLVTGPMEQAAYLFGEYGFPGDLGGGAATAPIMQPGKGLLGFAGSDLLQQSVQPGASAGQMRDQLGQVMDHLKDNPSGPANPSDGGGSGHQFSSVVAQTQAGAALGAVVGSFIAGPVGATVGGIIGGIVSFVAGLLDSSPSHPPAAASAQPAKDAAAGTKACVAPTIVIVTGNNNTVNIGKDGTVHKNGAPPQTPPPSAGPHRPSPGGSPHKCELRPDETIPEDFSLPYWATDAVFAPSIVPTGTGAEALLTLFDADIVSLADRITVDQFAEIDQEGFLASALGRGRATIPVRTSPRTETLTRATELVNKAVAVRALRDLEIPASTLIRDLSVALRTPSRRLIAYDEVEG